MSRLAGVAGFEPARDGTKNRCLTTWRHPNVGNLPRIYRFSAILQAEKIYQLEVLNLLKRLKETISNR